MYFRRCPHWRPGALACSFAILVASAPLAGRNAPDSTALSETEQIIHVLNRLAYGPRPGDIDKVRALGLRAYIERQLQPESIDDRVVDDKIRAFRTLHMSSMELLTAYPPVAAEGRRHREPATRKRDALMAARSGSRQQREAMLPSGSARAARERAKMDRPSEFEYLEARLIRATLSERQLHELMVDFWLNHFNIDYGDEYLIVDFEERVVRPHALGTFSDLLRATARHPAMLDYLNNYRSVASADVIRARVEAVAAGSLDDRRALARRRLFFKSAKGLNENYARELMELHTLGVDGGYTQKDVIQVAKCFTGWTIVDGRDEMGMFGFEPLIHEPGDKLVLGQTIPSGGIDEGERVLSMLATHPSTARFVSKKLVRRFVADDPPEAVVKLAAQAFQRTGGDIREVLRAIFNSQPFMSRQFHQAKIKKPIELVISALRAVNAEVDTRSASLDQITTPMGENLYDHPAPDGFPDTGASWVNTNALFRRLDFAFTLASGSLPGVTPQLVPARALLRQMGIPEPTAAQIAKALPQLKPTAAGASSSYSMMMTSGTMAPPTGGAAEASAIKPGEDLIAVAAMLGSPHFQKR